MAERDAGPGATTLATFMVDVHSTPLAVPALIRLRRWWLLLLSLWLLLMGVALQLHLDNLRQQAITVALEGARNMFHSVVLARQWNASHGGVYVPVTPQTQPNRYLDDPQRDLTTTDGTQLTKINPAYMTRMLAEQAQRDGGVVFRLTSLRPLNPANAPDPWERTSLVAFEKGAPEAHAVVASDQDDLLRYMAPLKVTAACLKCHQGQHYKVGDVRGGISVSQPYGRVMQASVHAVREARLTYAGVAALAAAVGWLLLELLRRRWIDQVAQAQQLTQTQQRLMQADKVVSVGHLAAGMAHQINNPLAFVTANMHTLADYSEQLLRLLDACRAGRACEEDFAKADLDFVRGDLRDLLLESQGGLDRIKKLVAQLKDFSQIDRDAWRWIDLNACIESALQVTHTELGERIELVRELGQLPCVRCAAAHMNQVIRCLLLNAAQAIVGTGRLTVRSSYDEQHVWVEVADNGVGMTDAVKQQMFEPFFTTHPNARGLGLSAAQDIVAAHGGHFEVTTAPGMGTTVRFCLPVLEPQDNSPPQKAADRSS